MALGMGNIANMLARGGMITGQSIGQPVAAFGQQMGGLLGGLGQRMNDRDDQAKAMELLEANKNNPEALGQLAAQYAAQGKDALANAFAKAAQASGAARTRAEDKFNKDADQKQLVGRQRSLIGNAMAEAGRRNDLAAVERFKGFLKGDTETGAELAKAYLQKEPQEKKPEPKTKLNFTTETLVENGKPMRYSIARDPETGEIVQKNLLGEAGSTAKGKGGAAGEDPEKAEVRRQSGIAKADNVLRTIDRATEQARDAYDWSYDVAKFLPGTNARALAGDVDTLKAALSFDSLQEMRDNSPTGGALGQVSNMEIQLLASQVAALDPGMGDEEFFKRLEEVQRRYMVVKAKLTGEQPENPNYRLDPDTGKLFFRNEDGEIVDLGAY